MLLFVINLVLDVFVSRQLMNSKNVYYSDWNDIILKKIDADVIIMGNSRAECHYNPMIIDSVLNVNSYVLGVSGSALNRQIVKYNIYAHYQQNNPKLLMINLDYTYTFTWTIGVDRQQFFPYMLLPYTREQILTVEPFNMVEKYFPIYRYTTFMGIYYLQTEYAKITDESIKGYRGRDLQWDPEGLNKVESYHFEVDPRTMKMFDKFLAARKAENINIVFVFSPIYFGLTEKVDNLQEVYDTFHTFSERYNIPILDYSLSDVSRDTTCFYNAFHMNNHGAEIFSRQLAHDVDSLGIISQ